MIISTNLLCSVVPNFLSNKGTFFSFDNSLQSTLNMSSYHLQNASNVLSFSGTYSKVSMVLYIVVSFSGAIVQFNDFNSNSSIWFCHSSLFINACRSLSSFLCCCCCCCSFCCCHPAVLPFSVAFHHSSVDSPSELLTFVQLFSGVLHYWIAEIFVKLTTNFFIWKKREQTQKTVITVFFSTRNQKGRNNKNKIFAFFFLFKIPSLRNIYVTI